MSVFKKIIYCFLLLWPLYSEAQFPFYKKTDVEEENLTIKSTALLKDRYGFLWVGTSEGIFKYSNAAPEKIATDEEDTRYYITALFEDEAGVIWAGCKNGTILNVQQQTISLYTPAEGLPKASITAIVQAPDKQIWFATAGEGIYYTSKGHFNRLTAAGGLSDDYVNCLYLAGNTLVAGTDRGLSFINCTTPIKTINVFTAKNGLPDNIVKCIIPSQLKNNIWVGTQSKGFLQFDITTKQLTVLPAAWSYGEINDLYEGREDLFIATEQNGIIAYNKTAKAFKKTIFKDSMLVRRVSDMQADNEENIWLATDNKLVSFTGTWLTYWRELPNLPLPKIHTLFADNDNTLWFTPDFRLYEGNQLLQQVHSKLNSYDITPPEELVDITCLYKDRFGYLWVGTMGKGVFRMNTLTGQRRQITENEVTNNGHILSIAGKGDEVWISTLNGVARFYLNNTDNGLAPPLAYTNYSKKDGLGSDYIYHILVDTKNRVWFATDGAGVCVYEHNLFLNYYQSKLFPSKVAYSLAEDKNGHIWISTYGDGLFEFDDKKFINYKQRNGLTDLAITSLGVDNQNNIVVVNKKGIDIFNPRKNIVQHIGAESGFTEQQPNLNSITRDQQGNLWIGTDNGIVRFNAPASFGTVAPHAVIETVQLFGTLLHTASDSIFNYTQNSFTFKVAAAYYKAPEKIKFQYWLEGYSENWEVTANRLITFSQLHPGHYRFKIRASANENFDASPVSYYEFTIERSFWTTWWFRTLLVVFLLALTALFVRHRIKTVRKKENALREKFQLQYDALKHQVNPHFLFNSFNALLNIVEDSPKEAAVLIKHLSQFYRKMTAHSQKELILVDEELELLHSYLYIQQKRFGSALQFSENLEPWIKKSTFIPPLVLQLLAENAIKHNSISREKPLQITLYTENEYLVLRNNINHKLVKEESEGVGLKNIENRYKLLTGRPVVKKEDETAFIIMVPLIYLN